MGSYFRGRKKASSAYFRDKTTLGPRTQILTTKIASVDHVAVASELEALLLEANFIKRYEPPFNVRWTDGKAYPFIKITIKDTYPAVLQSRRMDDPKALFFGPFPNIGDARRILKWVRRIFPYQSIRNHPKKHCLYYHLGLCPCPPLLDKEDLVKYRRNIRYLIQFLEGKKDSLLHALEKEMKFAAKNEDFEEAAALKHQIEVIKIITTQTRRPFEYIRNPNLLSDEAIFDLESLSEVLGKHGIEISKLSRIECYDISNTQGKEATGSMVVTTDGLIDKSQYRRFRVRLKNTPDDVAMHKEVLSRRLKREKWPMPDLIVIDGGTAQVNAARTVLKEVGIPIPVIGLAKRLEEIIIPATEGLALRNKSIVLPRNHRGLKLLQRLRDEAHRFALTYHRKLRQKRLLNGP